MPELESALTQLETSSLIRLAADEIDLSYIFKHALTQDAAYETLLKSRRAQLHREVAEAIERLWPERGEDNAAVLALHFERAGLDDKALSYAVVAGDMARRAFANTEALDFYERALNLAERLDDPRARSIYVNRGNVFEVMGDFPRAVANYEAMITSAQRRGDLAMEADGLNHLLTTQGATGDVPDAQAKLDRALELARRSGDQEMIVRVMWNIGLSIRFQDPRRAADYYRQALDLARAANLRELAAFALLDLDVELQLIGEWRESLECGRQALEEFRRLDNLPMIANALGMLAATRYGRGELVQAYAAGEEGLTISTTLQNPWGMGYNGWHLSIIDTDAGRFDRALAQGLQALAVTQPLGIPLFVGMTKTWLARVYVELDQLHTAQALADEGAQTLEPLQIPTWLAMARGVQGRIALMHGDLGRAHQLLDPLWREGDDPSAHLWGFSLAGPSIAQLALLEQRLDLGLHFCDWLLPHFEREEMWEHAAAMRYYRAQILMARGDALQAEADLLNARAVAENAGFKILLWRIDSALAVLYQQQGDAARADAPRRLAIDRIHALANGIADPEARDGFLHGGEVIRALGLFKYD
jgi:tetratricopeptide (TPR) repeat protein